MGVAAILVLWPRPPEQTPVSPAHRGFTSNFASIGPQAAEETTFETVDDGRRIPGYTISSPMSLNAQVSYKTKQYLTPACCKKSRSSLFYLVALAAKCFAVGSNLDQTNVFILFIYLLPCIQKTLLHRIRLHLMWIAYFTINADKCDAGTL